MWFLSQFHPTDNESFQRRQTPPFLLSPVTSAVTSPQLVLRFRTLTVSGHSFLIEKRNSFWAGLTEWGALVP